MLVVKSNDKELIVACVGFFIEGSRNEYDHRVTIQGILATIGTPVELGRYDKVKAYEVLDRLQGAFGVSPTFNMP